MKKATNVVGVQHFVNRLDDEAVRGNEAVAYATERWDFAVEKHYPKKLKIVDFEVFNSGDDLLKLPAADTLTMITADVDSYSLHLLNHMVMKRRFRSIQVLGMKFPDEEIPPAPLEECMELRGNLYLPKVGKPIETTCKKVHLLKILEIQNFEDLIEPLVQTA